MTVPTRTGIANLPLHHGKALRWLFDRMVKLSREITYQTGRVLHLSAARISLLIL